MNATEPAEAVCSLHPDEPADGVCARCGSFLCFECRHFLAGEALCAACIVRPDVNYLVALRNRLWGRRDLYVWWFGTLGLAVSLLNVVGGASYLVLGESGYEPNLLLGIVGGVVYGSYLMLRPWARGGLFAVLFLTLLVSVLTGDQPAAVVLPFLFFTVAYRSTRNMLAFRMEVSAEALERLHRDVYANLPARWGLLLGGLSLVVPFLALVSLPLSVVGLRRVDPKARPPVGLRRSALAGIALSALGLLSTVAMAFWALSAQT